MRIGKELVEDPEYQKRLKEGLFNNKKVEIKSVKNKRSAMISVIIFILATAFIVLFGSFEGMRPSFLIDGEIVTLGMSSIIEIVMLSAAAIILLVTKTDGIKATQGSVFPAGMQAVIAIFGMLDGRYLSSGKYGTADSLYPGNCATNAVVVRCRPVCDVYPAI